MGLFWRRMGVIAPGGTVLGISHGYAGEHWLLTESGGMALLRTWLAAGAY